MAKFCVMRLRAFVDENHAGLIPNRLEAAIGVN